MMKMAEKMTIMEQINAISYEGLTEEQFDFLVDRAKRSVRPAHAKKGLTKTQKENLGIKQEILNILASADAGMTATAVGNTLEISCQKASALLKQMVDDGYVIKGKADKAIIFTLPETEEEEEVEEEEE